MSANDQSAHSPLELISQSRLGGPGLSRSRRRLSALKRRNSSSSALFFSSRRVMRDFGSSLPRNFSSALSTESFSVMIQASPLLIVAGAQWIARPHDTLRTTSEWIGG